jgi:hypothetical protein
MPLDLVVADLWPPTDAPAEMRTLRLPSLEKWLARADIRRVEARGAADWLAAAFGLRTPAPVAPIALAAESRVPDGAWLRADPVYLRIDRDMTAMHSAAQLAIGRDEADALVATLQAHFANDGLEFLAPSPERWYIHVPAGEIPETIPPGEARGRDAQRLLPVSRGSLNWAGLLTEAQMLLSSHDVNVRRENASRPPINSLWLWGGGELPASVACDYRRIYANEVFARGLGVLAQARVADVPRTLGELRDAPPNEWLLVVIDALSDLVQRGDAAGWADAARALERDWFDAIPQAVDRFGSVRVVLPGPKDTLIAGIGRAATRRWFRRRAPLSSYA